MYKNSPLKRVCLLACLNLSPTLTKPTTLVPKETGQKMKIILTFSLRDIQHAENNQNDDIYYSG